MKNIFHTALLTTVLGFFTFAQNQDTTWTSQVTFGANGTQSSFVNWNAGGRNNVSVQGFINATAKYAKKNSTWDNYLILGLGGLQYIGAGSGKESLQKTDDRIEFGTIYGRKIKNRKLYSSFFAAFKTQFIDGFNYPNDSVRVSTFMAPGYANLGWGVDYKPTKHLSLFLSPVSSKMTFVNDQLLADVGSFGVDGAEYNSTGDVITKGKRFRGEFGAYFKLNYKKEIVKNITMSSTLDLFSNYLDNPQNIDVNADVLFNFKVNGWLSASLNWTLLYDDDIDIRDNKGGIGPRTQFKSVLGLGVSYTVKNREELDKADSKK